MAGNTITERTNAAAALTADGRHVEAIEILRELVGAAPTNVVALHNLAAALGDAGQNAEAVDILERAFGLGLNAPESWLVYGRAQLGVRAFDKADQAFQRLLSMRPADHTVHSEYAQLVWMRTGDRDKALDVINQAIAAFPNVGPLHIARAKVIGQMGDHETEFSVYKEAHRLSGAPALALAACNAALATDRYEEGLRYGREAAERCGERMEAASAYCNALLAVGDAAAAAQVADRLIEQAPNNQLYNAQRATAWRLLGDDRYRDLFDYDKFVYASPLDAPAGWETLSSYLDDLLEALEAAHRFRAHPFFQSVRHGSQISSIEGAPAPAMRAYRDAAIGPVRRYAAALGQGDDPLRRRNIGGCAFYSTWSISLPPNGYHVNHVHPEGWISSACHIRPPIEEPGAPHAGWLKFGEPGFPTTPKLAPERYVKPEPGVIVMFPSYMWHGTVGFSAGPERVTVAGDIVPRAPVS